MSLALLRIVILCATLLAPIDTGSSPSIHQVATLHNPRAAHTATTLPSGQVLLVGGLTDGEGSLASAELFDPASNTVQEVASLREARVDHTATLLADGRVLIAGGYNGKYLASVEVYDPSHRRFVAGAPLREGRSGHTATILSDGRILFCGGVGEGWTFLSSAELYDPASGRSEAVGPMSLPRESHTATLLTDGRVLVIGGHAGRRQDMQVYGSTEVFNPGTRRFTLTGSLVTPRHKHDALRLADGRVLVIGGADRTDRNYFTSTEIYDPQAGAFASGPAMKHPRYKIVGTSVLLPNGDVLVAAGASVAELLPAGSSAFHDVPGQFPAGYQFAASARLPSGDVLITGGYDQRNVTTAGVWRFGSR